MKEAQLIVDGKTINITISDEELAKLQPPKPKKTGYERVGYDENYWCIDYNFKVFQEREDNYNFDKEMFAVANYFNDEEVAKNMARAQLLWNRIHRRAIELSSICCESKDLRYTIRFSSFELLSCAIHTDVKYLGVVYFATEAHCKQVIDEFRDELMWYFTEFRDRADM